MYMLKTKLKKETTSISEWKKSAYMTVCEARSIQKRPMFLDVSLHFVFSDINVDTVLIRGQDT